MHDRLTVVAGNSHPALAAAVAQLLEIPQCQAHVGRFPDGEIDVKVYDDLRGADVFILQSTCPHVNDHIMELLLLLDTCRRASAGRITAVIPYYGYARKDRKDEGRVPISAKVVANAICGAGAERVLTVDLHAAQIQGFFDIPVDHLYAKPVLMEYLRTLKVNDPVVVAPDMGGLKRARAYAESLGASVAIVDKRRFDGEKVDWQQMIGEVKGKEALIIDDMITTGGSMVQAVEIAREKGATKVYALATHGVFCKDAVARLKSSSADAVMVTDTVPVPGDLPAKFHTRSVANLLARAIRAIHSSESVSALFKET